jgi:hypothetical protein
MSRLTILLLALGILILAVIFGVVGGGVAA